MATCKCSSGNTVFSDLIYLDCNSESYDPSNYSIVVQDSQGKSYNLPLDCLGISVDPTILLPPTNLMGQLGCSTQSLLPPTNLTGQLGCSVINDCDCSTATATLNSLNITSSSAQITHNFTNGFSSICDYRIEARDAAMNLISLNDISDSTGTTTLSSLSPDTSYTVNLFCNDGTTDSLVNSTQFTTTSVTPECDCSVATATLNSLNITSSSAQIMHNFTNGFSSTCDYRLEIRDPSMNLISSNNISASTGTTTISSLNANTSYTANLFCNDGIIDSLVISIQFTTAPIASSLCVWDNSLWDDCTWDV